MSKSKGKGKAVGRLRRNGDKEREWRALLDEQRGSGLSVRAFCRGRGLHETSFYYWRREIGMRDREAASERKETSPPIMAPVVFVDEPRGNSGETRDTSTDRKSSSIEIMLGRGTKVLVGPHSSREQLAAVLDVLEQSRC